MNQILPFIVGLSRLGAIPPIGDITVRLRVTNTVVQLETTSDLSAYGESYVVLEYTRA